MRHAGAPGPLHSLPGDHGRGQDEHRPVRRLRPVAARARSLLTPARRLYGRDGGRGSSRRAARHQGSVPVSGEQTIDVVVKAIEQVTPLIKHFKLASPGGEALPAFSGGSHVIVVMRGEARVHRNPYSLLSAPHNLEHYEIAVRRMEESRGGSHYMHDRLTVGSRLEIAHPVNLFGLDKIARKHVLIAGGIG